jgi:tRNA(Ile)-lysidine synthase
MVTDLLRSVSTYIERHQLIKAGDHIVVGVSGGPDSVTLLHLLQRLSVPLDLALHVAHLNHAIRGEDSEADVQFVAELAHAVGLPFTTETINIPRLSEEAGLAIEETARRERYAFLARVAEKEGAQTIAVGHNADDQSETVLMHLLRGSGPAGLRGMLPATRLRDYRLLTRCGKPPGAAVPPEMLLIRPLLGTTRADIETYCQDQELATRFDRSNLDTTYFRNRLRYEVIPELAKINPQFSERLCNLADVVRADYQLLQEFVRVAQDTLLIATHPDAVIFDLARWREQPLAIQRALVRRSAYRLHCTLRDVDFDHVDHAVDVAQRGQTGAQAVLPRGLRLTVGYTTLMIAQAHALHLPAERPWLAPDDEIAVAVPGTTPLPQGWTLHAQLPATWDLTTIRENPNPLVAWMDAEALGDTPVLRTRQVGDRFAPQGMRGSEVRLSDFLINTKLPRRWRDHLPLLTSSDRILWAAGMRLSERALVSPRTERVIHLRFHAP